MGELQCRTIGMECRLQKPPTPMDIVPAMSSATPPRTTIFEFPKLESPAVKAKGTVNPSDKPIILCGVAQSWSALSFRLQTKSTHASRTTSGFNRCLSSFPFRSLQHSPFRDRLCLSHFVSMSHSGMLSFKEGAFEFITESSGTDTSHRLITRPFGWAAGRACLRFVRCSGMASVRPGSGDIVFLNGML